MMAESHPTVGVIRIIFKAEHYSLFFLLHKCHQMVWTVTWKINAFLHTVRWVPGCGSGVPRSPVVCTRDWTWFPLFPQQG